MQSKWTHHWAPAEVRYLIWIIRQEPCPHDLSHAWSLSSKRLPLSRCSLHGRRTTKRLFLENEMLPFCSEHFPLESLCRSNIHFLAIEPILAKAGTTLYDLFWPVMKGKHFENDSTNGSHQGEHQRERQGTFWRMERFSVKMHFAWECTLWKHWRSLWAQTYCVLNWVWSAESYSDVEASFY